MTNLTSESTTMTIVRLKTTTSMILRQYAHAQAGHELDLGDPATPTGMAYCSALRLSDTPRYQKIQFCFVWLKQ